jgi:hypothetical protein
LERLEFFLFRVTVHSTGQRPLFVKDLPKPEIIRRALQTASPISLRGDSSWLIGNRRPLDDAQRYFYFALGRSHSAVIPQRDDRGNFIDVPADIAPYTHAVIDTETEVCAIARKSELSPTIDGIGRGLARLLSESSVAREHLVRVDVSPIKEPAGFVDLLLRAHTVTRLWVVTTRPNPWDVEKDFIQPTSRVLEELHGEAVKTEWKGPSLAVDSPHISTIINSTAATGGDAGATVRESPKGKANKIRLGDKLSSFPVDIEEGTAEQKAPGFLLLMHEAYAKVRNRK